MGKKKKKNLNRYREINHKSSTPGADKSRFTLFIYFFADLAVFQNFTSPIVNAKYSFLEFDCEPTKCETISARTRQISSCFTILFLLTLTAFNLIILDGIRTSCGTTIFLKLF